jgi:hypothetical protein
MPMRAFLFATFFLLVSTIVRAQETDTTARQLYLITLQNGVERIGYILSDDGREVLLETSDLGKIYITKADILKIQKIDNAQQIIRGELRKTGPFTTRYAFTTNALPIKKGEDYAMVNLYGPEVHFAVTDHFNIGVMSTWIASPFILALKYSFPTKSEKCNFSLGALLGTTGYLNTFRGFGGLYWLNATFGERGRNFTIGLGYGHVNTGMKIGCLDPGVYYYNDTTPELYPQEKEVIEPMIYGPVLSIAGIFPVGVKASLVFDSMFGYFRKESNSVEHTVITEPDYVNNIPGSYSILSTVGTRNYFAMFLMPGMRFQTKPDRAFQVSLAGVLAVRENRFPISFPAPFCTWYFKF